MNIFPNFWHCGSIYQFCEWLSKANTCYNSSFKTILAVRHHLHVAVTDIGSLNDLHIFDQKIDYQYPTKDLAGGYGSGAFGLSYGSRHGDHPRQRCIRVDCSDICRIPHCSHTHLHRVHCRCFWDTHWYLTTRYISSLPSDKGGMEHNTSITMCKVKLLTLAPTIIMQPISNEACQIGGHHCDFQHCD